MKKEECPYCAEVDELIDYTMERMCPLCAEHFQNESDQYNEHLDKTALKRRCAKAILIRTTDHKEGEFSYFKGVKYSVRAAAKLRARYGDRLVEIINERFI